MADETPAAPAAPDTVTVVDGIGQRWEVPTENAPAALARGARLETLPEAEERQREAKYGNREAEAAAAGLARSASFGASDWALTKPAQALAAAPGVGPFVGAVMGGAKALGVSLPQVKPLVEPSTLAGLAQYNSGATMAGEAAGIFTPGPGVVGKAGGGVAKGVKLLLGESLLARAAAKGLGAGLEGSFYGAGSALSESSLGDTQLTAEKLLAHMSLGALIGAGAGVAGELLESGARPILRKVAAGMGTLQDEAKGLAERMAVKAAGAIKGDVRAYSREELQKLGRDLLDAGLISPGAPLEDVLAKAQAGKEFHGKAIGGILEQADIRSGNSFDFKAVRDAIDNDLAQPNRQNPLRLADLEAVLKHFDGVSDTVPFAVANDIKARLNDGLFNKLDPPARLRMAERVSGILNDQIETQLGNAAPDLADSFLSAKRLYGVHKEAVGFAEQGLQRQAGNRFISLSDHLLGLGGLGLGGPVGGIVGGLGNKLLRERGAGIAATGLDALAKSPIFSTVSQAFAGFVQQGLVREPGLFGRFREMLQQAAARSDGELLLTHGVLSESDPQYRDAMSAAGLDYSEPGVATSQRALALGAVRAQLAAHDKAIQEAVDGALQAAGPRGGVSARHALHDALGLSGAPDFDAQAQALRALASSPDALAERMGSAVQPLAGDAPTLATALGATATRAVQFLASKLPAADPLEDVPALRRRGGTSDAARSRFERYASAVADPNTVYESLREGAVTREAIEALQAVYPKLYADFQRQAMERLALHLKPITYQQRLGLGRVLGTALDASARPDRLLATQQMLAAMPAKQQARPAQVKPESPSDGMSQSQRLEARR